MKTLILVAILVLAFGASADTPSLASSSESSNQDCDNLQIYKFADWSNCDLSGENFNGLGFIQMKLVGTNLNRADLRKTLFMSHLKGASVREANFSGAEVKPSSRSYSMLDFSENDFEKSNFTGASFEDTSFNGSHLKEVDFSGSTFFGVNFYKANLESANFRNIEVICRHPNYKRDSKPVVEHTNFRKANLKGADFSGADLSCLNAYDIDTELEGAIYDGETKFPKMFNPIRAGMILRLPEEIWDQGKPCHNFFQTVRNTYVCKNTKSVKECVIAARNGLSKGNACYIDLKSHGFNFEDADSYPMGIRSAESATGQAEVGVSR